MINLVASRPMSSKSLPGRTNNLLGFFPHSSALILADLTSFYYAHRPKVVLGGSAIVIVSVFGFWNLLTFTVRSVVLLCGIGLGGISLFLSPLTVDCSFYVYATIKTNDAARLSSVDTNSERESHPY